jgi:hypothetical protein
VRELRVGGEGEAHVLLVGPMLRAAGLLCAVMLVPVVAARALPEHAVSACPDDGADAGYAPTADEALTAWGLVIGSPALPRQARWYGPELLPAHLRRPTRSCTFRSCSWRSDVPW